MKTPTSSLRRKAVQPINTHSVICHIKPLQQLVKVEELLRNEEPRQCHLTESRTP